MYLALSLVEKGLSSLTASKLNDCCAGSHNLTKRKMTPLLHIPIQVNNTYKLRILKLINSLSLVLEILNFTLQSLDLSSNCLTEIPSLATLQSLKFLDLGFNQLTKLRALETLNMAMNGLTGQIPPLWSLTSLKAISFCFNQLHGSLSEEGEVFLQISFLIFSHLSMSPSHTTILKVQSHSVHLATIPNSQVFELDSHNNKLNVDTENPHWKPLFQLKIFRLSNCILNTPSRVIPSFLWNQYDLRVVNLSHNGMMGEAPTWLITNNTKLESLSLGDNFLRGPLLLHPDARNLDMFWLDVSLNQIHSKVPTFIGSVLPNLLFLNMSINALQGTIPASLGDIRKLESLDLSHNNFSGEIPEHVVMGCVSLRFLKLSNNNLQGQLLPAKSNLTELWSFDFQYLSTLVLSKNSLEGTMPVSFCELRWLSFLDLSSLRYLHLQGNEFMGPVPHISSGSSSLVTLDIRNNKFAGEIPSWISSFFNLRVLLLKGNNLEGPTPHELCQLKNLSILDISSNNFSGLIPSCFYRIHLMKHLTDMNLGGQHIDPSEHTHLNVNSTKSVHMSRQISTHQM
ncbi:hypothetical protein Pfo_000547 [Paulownia fortunei]|nr:hypothetical protein Pfo_000547 [Paulownia fortunei]